MARLDTRLAILQVPVAYAPSIGGVETCTREVSVRLRASGHDVRVLTSDPSHELPRSEIVGGVPVARVRAYPRGSDVRLSPMIGPAVHRAQPSIVHVQCYQTFVAPAAMLACARARIPYVLTFHGGGHSNSLRHRLRDRQMKILRPLLARADALIATAEWEIDAYGSLLTLDRDRFHLIPNGGDLPTPRARDRTSEGTLIVSIGRAERFKGHHRVINAMPHVIEHIPDARLWIAGSGPYEEDLARLARKLGIIERVEIGAITDRGQYTDRLASAGVAALFSDHETHPMAALEAIALGVPTVVADNSGLAELARKGFARPVSLAADSRSHADSIVSSIREPRHPLSPEIRLPTWDDCGASLLDLYQRVVSRPRTS